jgi:RNA polymerase sigma-70 factor (ECF subfamily)
MVADQLADPDQRLDLELVRKAQDGEVEAFGQLYERHVQSVFRFVYSHIDNHSDAEDLTEDVFLRVWRAIPKYQEQGVPFIAFLIRIARNVIIDFYRSSRRENLNLPLDDIQIAGSKSGLDENLIQGQTTSEIRALLANLKNEYRLVLVLRFINELSPDEIADVMGKSSGAVRVIQFRALAALRKLMDSK